MKQRKILLGKAFIAILAIMLICVLCNVAFISVSSAGTIQKFSADGTINNTYWGIAAANTRKALSNVAALNKALLYASQNGIQTVKLKKATYYVDGQHTRVYSVSNKSIKIPSNISFDLGGSTLIQVPNNKEGYAIFTVIGSSNVSIANGILVGDRLKHTYTGASTKTHEYGFGIDVRAGTDINLSNLNIYNMTGDSILVGGNAALANGGKVSEKVTITNCNLHDNRRQGLSIIGAKIVTVSGCTIYNIGLRNGTNPMCGIDLENTLDWPIESVHIINNKFYGIKKASVLVHKGSSNTLVQQNNISGYVALVYGERTSINGNTITDGGIYSVDTSGPLYTYIDNNVLINASIEIKTNKGTVISNNTVTNGTIKLNYASGAIFNNKISNQNAKNFAIQVYADNQVGNYNFQVFLYGNTTDGTYENAVAVSNYSNLKVSNGLEQTQLYINNFGEEPIPQGVLEIKPNYTLWIIAGVAFLLAVAVLLWFLLRKKINRRGDAPQ